MPRPTIEYLNARRELRKGSDHTSKRRAKYAPDYEPEPFELAMSAINGFALWAESSRYAYLASVGMSPAEDTENEIPF